MIHLVNFRDHCCFETLVKISIEQLFSVTDFSKKILMHLRQCILQMIIFNTSTVISYFSTHFFPIIQGDGFTIAPEKVGTSNEYP